MKINKLFLGLAVACMGVLTSCNTDVEGAFYNNTFENVSFAQDESAEITTDQETVTVDVIVNRANKKGALTAHYTTEASEEGIFTDDGNGVIEFADGQASAVIKVTAANMAKGVDYVYTLTLSDDEILERDTLLENQIATTTVIIHSDYNWVAAGTCTFVDYTFTSVETGESAKNVPIIHAEGTNLYRIVQPFIAIYGSSFSYDSGIDFYLEEDGSINFGFNQGYIYDVYDDADNYGYWDTTRYASYCTIKHSGNIFQISHLLVYNGNLYTGAFSFQWNGYPGK